MLLCLRRSSALMTSVWRPSQSSNWRVALTTFITRQRYDHGQAKSTEEKANETCWQAFLRQDSYAECFTRSQTNHPPILACEFVSTSATCTRSPCFRTDTTSPCVCQLPPGGLLCR